MEDENQSVSSIRAQFEKQLKTGAFVINGRKTSSSGNGAPSSALPLPPSANHSSSSSSSASTPLATLSHSSFPVLPLTKPPPVLPSHHRTAPLPPPVPPHSERTTASASSSRATSPDMPRWNKKAGGEDPPRSSSFSSLPPIRRPPIAPKPKILDSKLPIPLKPPPQLPKKDPPSVNGSPKSTHSFTINQDREEPPKEAIESVRDRAKKIQETLIKNALYDGMGTLPRNVIARQMQSFMEASVDTETPSDEDEGVLDTFSEGVDGDAYDGFSDSNSGDLQSLPSISSRGAASDAGGTSRIHRISSSSSNVVPGYGPAEVHELIMKELKTKGVYKSPGPDGIPVDVGKLRPHDSAANRRDNRNAASGATTQSKTTISSSSSYNPSSFCDSSNRSSSVSTSDPQDDTIVAVKPSSQVPDVVVHPENTEEGEPLTEEEENARKLKWAALEFLTVQKTFVEYLNMIIYVYPEYLVEFGKQKGLVPILDSATPPTGPTENQHVVHTLQRLLKNYHTFHSTFLLPEIQKIIDKWDSNNPNMSSVFIKSVPFLKECVPFLKEKTRIATELSNMCKENPDFYQATLSFERHLFNRGVGAVIQQLDQVHQNFMRYKILMQRYAHYLPAGGEELKKSEQVIEMLEKVSQDVNVSMGLATTDQLLRLHAMFQNHFDVFKPGRRLLLEESVKKQTRKDAQGRTLLLFSDVLWICRTTSSLGSAGLFDIGRSYRIPVEEIKITVNDNIDYEDYMEIRSKKKSAGIWFKSKATRDEWARVLTERRDEVKALKRRLTVARRKERTGTVGASEMEETPRASFCRPTSFEASDPMAVKEEGCSDPGTPINGIDDDGMAPASSGTYKEAEQPVWINDKLSTKCLMDGCDNEFNLISRRHHCRNCGWLICRQCMGFAPVEQNNFSREIVCPECYDNILQQYRERKLFPEHMMVEVERGVYQVILTKKKGKESERVNPDTLFKPPVHSRLRRIRNLDDRLKQGQTVFSKVYLRQKTGGEKEMHALLADEGVVLRFYRAAFDKSAAEQHVILGYSLRETDLRDTGGKGILFELRHINQYGPHSDNEQHVVAFRVTNEKSANMWSKELRKALEDSSLHE